LLSPLPSHTLLNYSFFYYNTNSFTCTLHSTPHKS
jgi:hypothetical protein